MATKHVTSKTVEKYLDRHGWSQHTVHPLPGHTEGTVASGWMSPTGLNHGLTITPYTEKNALIFRAGGVFHASPDSTPADQLSGMLMAMGYLNYESVLGAWAYDPGDGEVVFKLAIATDGGDISYEQFEHCLTALVVSVEVDAKNLKSIADGSRSAVDFLKAEGAKI